MFGVVIPGLTSVLSHFQPLGTPDQQRFALSIPLPLNYVVQSLCVFLLPGQQQLLPSTHGCSIYLSNNGQNWEYMGCLLNNKPSLLINPPLTYDSTSQNNGGFGFLQPQLQQQQQQQHMLHIGISLESLDTLKNLEDGHLRAEQNQANQVVGLAKFLARNLFNYMSSFIRRMDNRDMIVLPTNALDTWMNKIMSKLQNDPYFWKRATDQ